MTSLEALQQHRQICDEIYGLVLEESRFLQQNRRPPAEDLLSRKRALLERLDDALNALRTASKADLRHPEMRTALDEARSRILQILQIEKENEQLLLRHSLNGGGSGPGPAAAAPPGMLQKIYARNQ